jgi:hypothetical protein
MALHSPDENKLFLRSQHFSPVRNRRSPHTLYSPPPLRPPHSRFVHSEVVGDLMPDRISHHLFELCSGPRQTFVWALENCDLVRHCEPLENGAARERPTLVQAEYAWPRWLLFDDDRNVLHLPAEAPWNTPQRVLDQEFKFGNRQHSPSS